LSDAMVEFTLPVEVYEQAKEVLGRHGLAVEDAVIWMYNYVAATGKLPFPVPTPKDHECTP